MGLLKIICCILVVLLHSPQFLPYSVFIAYRSLTAVAVPCFMSITGYYVFYKKEYDNRSAWLIAWRFFIIYLIWTTAYNYMYFIFDNEGSDFISYWINHSDGWTIWYIKVYFEIMIVYPLIRPITKSDTRAKMYSFFWLIFICLRFSLTQFGINEKIIKIIQIPFFQFSDYFGGTLAAFFPMEALGYYIAGGFLVKIFRENRIPNMTRITKIIVSFGGVILTIAITCFTVIKYGTEYFNNPLQPYNIWIAFSAFGFMLLFFDFTRLYQEKLIKLKGVISYCSDKTLGVYLIQIFIKKWLLTFSTFSKCEPGETRLALVFLIMLIGSFLFSAFCKKIIPERINRYIL